ncbi:MAG: hypothetical protein JWM78_619 [Verrucomicrobiaceae bacterium]|nr:hypothetical protein [Verrucomicrobiaceae bacterium]
MNEIPVNQMLLRMSAACRALDTSRNGLRLLQEKYPDFPRALKFGSTRQAAVYFDAVELRAWIEQRKAARDAQ